MIHISKYNAGETTTTQQKQQQYGLFVC